MQTYIKMHYMDILPKKYTCSHIHSYYIYTLTYFQIAHQQKNLYVVRTYILTYTNAHILNPYNMHTYTQILHICIIFIHIEKSIHTLLKVTAYIHTYILHILIYYIFILRWIHCMVTQ